MLISHEHLGNELQGKARVLQVLAHHPELILEQLGMSIRLFFNSTRYLCNHLIKNKIISKRFVRAGSETCSPLPARITRTRARSIDLESLSDQNKSQPSSPIKIRRQASISGSQIKEQIELEDRIPYVRLDATIVEADEITSGNFFKLLFTVK